MLLPFMPQNRAMLNNDPSLYAEAKKEQKTPRQTDKNHFKNRKGRRKFFRRPFLNEALFNDLFCFIDKLFVIIIGQNGMCPIDLYPLDL